MKKTISFLLALMLLLAGCQAGRTNTDNPSSTPDPTGTSSTSPTNSATGATGGTTDPSGDTTVIIDTGYVPPEGDNGELYDLYNAYRTLNIDVIASIVYDPDGEFLDHPGKSNPDTSDWVAGGLYLFHIETGEAYEVTRGPTKPMMSVVTAEHLYFVPMDGSGQVYRSDLEGQNQVQVYESDYGSVTEVRYLGMDEKGLLVLTEEKDGLSRIVTYDLLTDETHVLLEGIENLSYMTVFEGDSYYETFAPYIGWRVGSPVTEMGFADYELSLVTGELVCVQDELK